MLFQSWLEKINAIGDFLLVVIDPTANDFRNRDINDVVVNLPLTSFGWFAAISVVFLLCGIIFPKFPLQRSKITFAFYMVSMYCQLILNLMILIRGIDHIQEFSNSTTLTCIPCAQTTPMIDIYSLYIIQVIGISHGYLKCMHQSDRPKGIMSTIDSCINIYNLLISWILLQLGCGEEIPLLLVLIGWLGVLNGMTQLAALHYPILYAFQSLQVVLYFLSYLLIYIYVIYILFIRSVPCTNAFPNGFFILYFQYLTLIGNFYIFLFLSAYY